MHRTTLVMMAAVVALGSSACTCGGGPTGPAVHRILAGASAVIQPGTQAGYAITANTGGSYRLVWTGDRGTSGVYRNFTGSLWTAGTITDLRPGCTFGECPLEVDDVLSEPYRSGNRDQIDFDAITASGIDGFDFVVDTEPVYFDLRIDGVGYPDLVFFPATDNGGAVSTAAEMPFGLTTR
jgi:hypothetical protein